MNMLKTIIIPKNQDPSIDLPNVPLAEQQSTSKICSTGLKAKRGRHKPPRSDSESDTKSYRRSMGETLLSYMLLNVENEDAYLHYFRQLDSFQANLNYESRPNVTVDIASLCIKSGNACLLRGGKESLYSNTALISLIQQCIKESGLPIDSVQFIDNPDRHLVTAMLTMKEYINLLIPRGGSGLVNFVGQNATMPVVTGGVGVCHTYIDSYADHEKARKIIFNAKVQRPTVCNALDGIIIHKDIAPSILPSLAQDLCTAGVELRCDARALAMVGPTQHLNVIPADFNDWGTEFLSLVAAVKVVDSLQDAIDHIEKYGSGHSEAIVTEDTTSGERFLNEVDAAAVYLNASTRFTDGSEFGLGAEVGISTQKFHARGPMGLAELTSYKWVIKGSGQIRE